MEEQILRSLLSNGLGGAAGQAPVLLLMWLLLKELRAWMPIVNERLKNLEANSLSVVQTATEVSHLSQRLQELKADQKDGLAQVRDRLALIESEQKAVWRKIGDRPSDRAT